MALSRKELEKILGKKFKTGSVSQAQDPMLELLTQQQAKKQEQPFFEKFNILPTVGAIGGGILGIPGGPMGIGVGGAAGAAIGETFEQTLTGRPNIKGLAGEAALGAAGGPLAKLLGVGRAGAVGAQVGKAGVIKTKAAQSFLRTTPGAFQKAADVGVDLNQVLVKHKPNLGVTFDEILGPIGKGAKGNIDELIKVNENVVQASVKQATGTQRLFGDDAIKALKGQAKLLKDSVDKTRYNALNAIIKQQEKVFRNGITPQRALSIVRAANQNFGRSILKEGVGSVSESADKVVANTLRNQLKTMFPDMAEGLTNQHELIILREVIKGARAGTRAGAVSKGMNIFNPLGVLERVLGSPQIGGRVAGIGGGAVPSAAAQAPTALGQATRAGAAQALPRGLGALGIGDQQETELPSSEELEAQGQTDLQSQSQGQEEGGFELTPEDVRTAHLTLSPENAARIEKAFKAQSLGQTDGGASQEFLERANQTMAAVEGTKTLGYGPVQGRLYQFQADVLGGAGLSKEVIGLRQKYEILRLNVLRAYQGARISDKDFELTVRYIPGLQDTDQTARTKLGVLKQLLNNANPPGPGQWTGSAAGGGGGEVVPQQEQPQGFSTGQQDQLMELMQGGNF